MFTHIIGTSAFFFWWQIEFNNNGLLFHCFSYVFKTQGFPWILAFDFHWFSSRCHDVSVDFAVPAIVGLGGAPDHGHAGNRRAARLLQRGGYFGEAVDGFTMGKMWGNIRIDGKQDMISHRKYTETNEERLINKIDESCGNLCVHRKSIGNKLILRILEDCSREISGETDGERMGFFVESMEI